MPPCSPLSRCRPPPSKRTGREILLVRTGRDTVKQTGSAPLSHCLSSKMTGNQTQTSTHCWGGRNTDANWNELGFEKKIKKCVFPFSKQRRHCPCEALPVPHVYCSIRGYYTTILHYAGLFFLTLAELVLLFW